MPGFLRAQQHWRDNARERGEPQNILWSAAQGTCESQPWGSNTVWQAPTPHKKCAGNQYVPCLTYTTNSSGEGMVNWEPGKPLNLQSPLLTRGATDLVPSSKCCGKLDIGPPAALGQRH